MLLRPISRERSAQRWRLRQSTPWLDIVRGVRAVVSEVRYTALWRCILGLLSHASPLLYPLLGSDVTPVRICTTTRRGCAGLPDNARSVPGNVWKFWRRASCWIRCHTTTEVRVPVAFVGCIATTQVGQTIVHIWRIPSAEARVAVTISCILQCGSQREGATQSVLRARA